MTRLGLAMALAACGCRAAPPPTEQRHDAPATCATLIADPGARRSLGDGRWLRLAAIADTRDASPAQLSAVRALASRIAREPVDAVVALGGLADDEPGITALLEALAGAGAPLLVQPGDREPQAALHGAIDRLALRGSDVVDLQRRRVLDGAVGLIALPGYPFATHLTVGDCRYAGSDLRAIGELARAPRPPALLLGYAPPHGGGDGALDEGPDGSHLGDPELTRLLGGDSALRLGLFAHRDGPTARANAALDPAQPVAEGEWSERLYVGVAPGADGAVRFEIDATSAHPRARWRTMAATR